MKGSIPVLRSEDADLGSRDKKKAELLNFFYLSLHCNLASHPSLIDGPLGEDQEGKVPPFCKGRSGSGSPEEPEHAESMGSDEMPPGGNWLQ